jgi:hypothetical protein
MLCHGDLPSVYDYPLKNRAVGDFPQSTSPDFPAGAWRKWVLREGVVGQGNENDYRQDRRNVVAGVKDVARFLNLSCWLRLELFTSK